MMCGRSLSARPQPASLDVLHTWPVVVRWTSRSARTQPGAITVLPLLLPSWLGRRSSWHRTALQDAPPFDFQREYLYQDQLYDLRGRPVAGQPGRAGERVAVHRGRQWALLAFQQPVTAPQARALASRRVPAPAAGASVQQSRRSRVPHLTLQCGRMRWWWAPGWTLTRERSCAAWPWPAAWWLPWTLPAPSSWHACAYSRHACPWLSAAHARSGQPAGRHPSDAPSGRCAQRQGALTAGSLRLAPHLARSPASLLMPADHTPACARTPAPGCSPAGAAGAHALLPCQAWRCAGQAAPGRHPPCGAGRAQRHLPGHVQAGDRHQRIRGHEGARGGAGPGAAGRPLPLQAPRSQVTTQEGQTGTIEGTFGKTGRFRVAFAEALRLSESPEQRVVTLRFRKYVFGPGQRRIAQ